MERAAEVRDAGIHLGVWHPEKQWFVYRADRAWRSLTLCPELTTLRQLPKPEQRLSDWVQMIQLSVSVWQEHGVGLDINPSNFARAGGSQRLYYVDDEIYPTLTERQLAGCIIARIPEEPSVSEQAWATWARDICKALQRYTSGLSWEALTDELRSLPLVELFEPQRRRVVAAFVLAENQQRRRRRQHGEPEKTCVFADVHANRPALEAVLSAAREHGVDSYLFLGDAVGYGPHPVECVQLLAALNDAVMLRGNHDHAIATGRLERGMNRLARQCAEWTRTKLNVSELSWLSRLETEHLGPGWMAVHGAPRDPHRFLAYVYDLTFEDNLHYLRQHARGLCFYGHTHVQLVHADSPLGPSKLRDCTLLNLKEAGPFLVNPGSVGQPRDGDVRAAFAIWDRTQETVSFHRTPYDVQETVDAIMTSGLPSRLTQRLLDGC